MAVKRDPLRDGSLLAEIDANGGADRQREIVAMKKLIVMSALAVALSVAAIADASAWTRNGTITGPRGTSTI